MSEAGLTEKVNSVGVGPGDGLGDGLGSGGGAGAAGVVLVSPMATMPLVASIVPETEPDRKLIEKLSTPSVVKSLLSVRVIVPVLLLIVTVPDVTPSVKSEPVGWLPDTAFVDQYNVVEFETLVVVIVNDAFAPSLTFAGPLIL